MSDKKQVVRINEKELVGLIDKIVSETVHKQKKAWIAEQASKNDKTSILESKIANLESKLEKLINNK